VAKEDWAIVWKADGESRFSTKDPLLTFGWSASAEEAMAKVDHALRFGTVGPLRSPEEFRRTFAGGTFYPLLVSLNRQVPGGRR